MKKIAIYIDGSNFYFSVKKKFGFNINIDNFILSNIKLKNNEMLFNMIN